MESEGRTAPETSGAAPERVSGSKPKTGLGRAILIALGLGLATGLFFGELAGALRVVGDAFIGLLQMTVLPYIVVALVLNIGRLTKSQAGMLFRYGALTLLLLWAVGLVTITVMAQAFPPMETGSFFSTKLVEPPERPSILGLFIPFNVFDSLVKDVVPAVVVFCLFLGVALLHTPGKERVIAFLDVVSDALMRVNGYVARLTPIGVFAMVASAAGTLTIEEFGRVQGYLLVYTLMVGILAFLVLPGLIATFTPFGYRQVLRTCSTALVTAFATGKVIIVLPMLIERTQELFREVLGAEEDADATVDVLYPLAYPFPHLGKLASLLFVPFAAWFVGRPLALLDYPLTLGAGLVSMFGGPIVAIPFLLDMADVPPDMMQLFLVSGIWAARVGDLLGVMHLVAFTLIAASAMSGLARFRSTRALRVGAVSVLAIGGAIAFSQVLLNQTFVGTYQRADVLAEMNRIRDTAPFVVLEQADVNPEPLAEGEDRLDRIARIRKLRVGFHPRQRPFSFLNPRGELVGFDIEMAHELARESDLDLVFVPVEVGDVARALDEDRIDIAMMGLLATLPRALETELSAPYLDVHPAVVTTADHVDVLSTLDQILSAPDLKLATADITIAEALTRHFPELELELVADEEAFFLSESPLADGLITSAEAASAWTLAYPDYRVVVPAGALATIPLAYPLPRGERELRRVVDRWIDAVDRRGLIQELYDHWVLGGRERDRETRWSILRDVLGWVE